MGGSSSKGGSTGTRKNFATIACVIGKGPLYGLVSSLLAGEVVWTGPLLRGNSSTPVNLTTKYGTIRIYWGTEDQPADPTLNQYEDHPSYPGIAYAVFVDFDHGQSTNAYNAEFIVLGGPPEQSIITGEAAAAATDSGLTVNPITEAAEVLTNLGWLGLSASEVDIASAQAVANAIQAEKVGGRCSTAVSPLYDSQQDARTVLSELAGLADAWLRVSDSGKVQFGRWEKAPDASSIRTITFDDLADWPDVKIEDQQDIPNSFAIEFTDSYALHKSAKIIVDDLAGIEAANGVLRRSNLSATSLITYEQALRAGQDAIRRAQKSGRWSGSIRHPKALNFAGERVQPGDMLTVPISAPGQTLYYQIIRVDTVTYPRDATAPVKVEGRFQPGSAATHTTAYVPPIVETPDPCVPPINLVRAFSLPAASGGEQPPVHIIACRPELTSAGFKVSYDDNNSGDFPLLGLQGSFALPMKLDAAAIPSATTLRLSLLPTGANGQRYDRDASYIRNWTGGPVEGRGDNLLVLLVALNNGAIISTEVCSVAGTPTIVDADTFDIPVLRARLGTSAKSWTAAAFTSLEAWVIPHGALVNFSHEDFMKSAQVGLTLYFHVAAYDHLGEYSPSEAWAERTRRVNASLQLGEYAAQPDGTTLYPVHSFVVSSGNYSAKVGRPELTNDNATIPAASDGSNPLFGEWSTTTMSVSVDDRDDSANWSFSASPSAGVTGSFNASTRTWTTSGFTTDAGYVDIVASQSGYANAVSRFTLSKARAGANGAAATNNATVILYKRSASAPTKPTVSTTFTFATGALAGQDGGWTQVIPANDGNPVYATAATASSTSATDTIAPGEWSAPVVIIANGANGANGTNGTNGTNGANGLNTASVYLFKRSASAPSLPTTTSTFTFSSGALTGHDNGWTQSVPSNDGNKLWVTTATAASTGTTDTIAPGEWAAVSVMAENGANGQSATAYWLVTSAATLKYASGVFAPTTVTFTGKAQTGSGSPGDYGCRFIIADSPDGSNFTDRYTSAANETSKTFTPSSTSVRAIRCRMYLAGGTSTQVDEETVNVVSDGTNGANGTNGTNGTNGATILGNSGNGGSWSSSTATPTSLSCTVPAGSHIVLVDGYVANPTGNSATLSASVSYPGGSMTILSNVAASPGQSIDFKEWVTFTSPGGTQGFSLSISTSLSSIAGGGSLTVM